MALQVERVEIFESVSRRSMVDLAIANVPSQGLRYLDVGKVGHVQSERWIGDAGSDDSPVLGSEEKLHERGGVEYDHRAARSVRMTSAGRRLSFRTGRAWRRSSTCWRIGRSRAFRNSRNT